MSKTRKGKGKRREVDAEPFLSGSDSQIQTKAYPTKTGILALPVELFDKILSEFEYATLDDFKQFARFSYVEDFKERENALRALSQTSKLLRTVCLPLLWERFQVVQRGQQDTGLRDKENAIYMEKASNSLMDTPHLAKLIKEVIVDLTRYNEKTAVPAFVKLLDNLPNMKVLYVIHASATMTSTIKNAFTGHSWPQVCSVMLPTSASAILSCCPNVEEVSCSHGDGDKLIGPMTMFCKKVHSLHGFNLRYEPWRKRLVKAFPRLQTYDIGPSHNSDFICNLSEFTYLTTIALDVWVENPKDLDNIQDVKTAQKVLQENKATGKKRLILRYGWKDGDPEYPQWKYVGTKTMSVS